MNEDQVKGRAKSIKGKVKESTGKAVGNKKLEGEGKAEQLGGKIQSGYGDLKDDVKRSTK